MPLSQGSTSGAKATIRRDDATTTPARWPLLAPLRGWVAEPVLPVQNVRPEGRRAMQDWIRR